MLYVIILVVGLFLGIVSALAMILLARDEVAENAPVGGFVASAGVVLFYGEGSAVITAGLLAIAGLTGYYCMLFLYKHNPLPDIPEAMQEETPPPARQGRLQDFL